MIKQFFIFVVFFLGVSHFCFSSDVFAQKTNLSVLNGKVEDLQKSYVEIWDTISLLQESIRQDSSEGDLTIKYLQDILQRLDALEKRLLLLESNQQDAVSQQADPNKS